MRQQPGIKKFAWAVMLAGACGDAGGGGESTSTGTETGGAADTTTTMAPTTGGGETGVDTGEPEDCAACPASPHA